MLLLNILSFLLFSKSVSALRKQELLSDTTQNIQRQSNESYNDELCDEQLDLIVEALHKREFWALKRKKYFILVIEPSSSFVLCFKCLTHGEKFSRASWKETFSTLVVSLIAQNTVTKSMAIQQTVLKDSIA